MTTQIKPFYLAGLLLGTMFFLLYDPNIAMPGLIVFLLAFLSKGMRR